jgi:hypothetical protein
MTAHEVASEMERAVGAESTKGKEDSLCKRAVSEMTS